MNTLKLSILALASTSLAACSSSGSDTTASTTAATFASQFATTEEDTAEKALKSDTPLEAGKDTSVALNYNFADKKTTHANSKIVKLAANSSGGIDFEVDGEKISLTSADQSEDNTYVKTLAGGESLFLWNSGSENLSELVTGADGTQYHRVLGYYLLDNNGPDNRGYSVFGTETPEDAIKKLEMTATYNGSASLQFYKSDITNNNGSDGRVRSRGQLELNADFAKSTISGSLTNIEVKDEATNEFVLDKDRTATFQEAQISGNGYSGKINSGPNIEGVYTGKFYGNDAQETSGTIVGNETEDGVETHRVIGVFSASKNTDN